jgi:hypothetical protein
VKTLKGGFKVYYPLERYSIGGILQHKGKRVESWTEIEPDKEYTFYPDRMGGQIKPSILVYGGEIYNTPGESEIMRKGEKL